MLGRALVLAVLLAAPVAAFTLTLPSDGIKAGSTASLATDATGGTFTLYAPTQTEDCRFPSATGSIPPNGVLGGLAFDRAGPWMVAIDDGSVAQQANLTVDPRPLQIYVTPSGPAAAPDYALQVRDGSQAVPNAYVDLYLGAAFIRHARTDASGRLPVPHDALPFAGTYSATAYRDLDDNNDAAPGLQVTEYPQAFTFQSDPPCLGTPAYDAPEEHGIGPTGTSLTRLAGPLDLSIREGEYQVAYVPGRTNITFATLEGERPTASSVRLMAAGVVRMPADVGLVVEAGPGYLLLAGNWSLESDLTVHLEHDANADGQPEALGETTIPVARDQPIRFVPVGDPTLSYQVPRRLPDGRPGTHALRFRLLDEEGREGRPPELPEGSVRLEGDLLGSSTVTFNAGGNHWEAFATPTSSDAEYRIVATWAGKGTVQIVVDLPPDGGAKAILNSPAPPLKAGVEQDIKVNVQRYNRPADESGLCSPTPACAYEPVTDAVVELFWADTGQPVRGPGGQAYRYDPGGPGTDCSCFELAGTYYFLAVTPERSGPMAAFATVSSGSTHPRHAYAPIPVVPRPSYNPIVTPSVVLAGEQTSLQLTAPGLAAHTRSNFVIRITNESTADVTTQGTFQGIGTALYWTAALPAGTYSVSIDDKLDVAAGLPGLNGTDRPAQLASRPAEVRFAYDDDAFRPELSDVGDLRAPRRDTYVMGNGFGDIQRLSVTVHRPDGTPAQGILTLDAHRQGVAFGLLAAGESDDPARLGGPQLFPPGQPLFISQGGQSYYLVETNEARSFSGELQANMAGSPVHLLAWGTGLGHTSSTFRSTTSNLNWQAPAAGGIHFIAPQASVLNITTGRGRAESPQLALSEDNLVLLKVRDPTGANDLDGLEIGLTRQIFGPTQRPGGILHYAPGATFGTVAISLRPDATGRLDAVAIAGPATAPVETAGAICYIDLSGMQSCDRNAVASTPLTLEVKHASQIIYDAAAGGQRVIVDIPSRVTEGAPVDVRARTSTQPFPEGTVTAFGKTHTLFNGARLLSAPAVNQTTDFPVVIEVAGFPALTRVLAVENAAAIAPNPTPNPDPTPTNGTTPGPAPAPTPAPNPTSAPTSQTRTTSAQSNADLAPDSANATEREGGLKRYLRNPAILSIALLLVLGPPAALGLYVHRAMQRRAATRMSTYEEEEPEPEADAQPTIPPRLAAALPPPTPPAPDQAPAATEATPDPPREPRPTSPFEQAVRDP